MIQTPHWKSAGHMHPLMPANDRLAGPMRHVRWQDFIWSDKPAYLSVNGRIAAIVLQGNPVTRREVEDG